MASIGTLVFALAAAGQAPAEADAVILQSVVSSADVSQVDVDEVEAFLETRIRDTWGVEVSRTPPIEERGRHFFVTLDWRGKTAAHVHLSERDVVHVDRKVAIADPKSGRAILWLAIRSSIERALTAMPPAPTVGEMIEKMADEAETSSVAEAPEPAPEPEPVAETAPEPAPESEPEPVAEAAPAPAPTPTTVEPARKRDPVDPRLWASFDSIWMNRPTPTAGAWSGSVLLRGAVDGGIGVGPSLQTHYIVGRWLTVGGEIGWYGTSPARDVGIDHIPLTLMAGTQPTLDIPLELGVRTTLDIQIVSMPNRTEGGARWLLGPYARSSLPFYVGERDNASFVAEFRLDFALARGAYTVNNNRIVDPFVGLGAAVGVEYRWH